MALTKLTDIRKSLSAEVNNLKVSGITTFTGSVSIGGTLTYQDVTNIDSVGLITARAGVNVSGGQLDVGSNIKIGNAGVVTATSFVGGLPITSGANDRVITASSASAIQGESTLTYGTTGQLTITRASQSNVGLYVFHSDGNEVGHFGNIGSGNEGILVLKDGGAQTVKFSGETGGDSYINSGKLLINGTSSIGVGRQLQINATSAYSYSGISLGRFANDTSNSGLDFVKSRSATVGGNTIVQSGDSIGAIIFKCADGNDLLTPAAEIRGDVDGTPGANDMPGRIRFSTTADGNSSLTELARMTSTRNLLLSQTAVEDWDGSRSHRLQITGDTYLNAGMSILATQNDSNPCEIVLGKSRSTGNTIVQNNDNIGQLRWSANDGNGFHTCAYIRATISNTPGSNDLPTKIHFGTATDGGVTVIDRMTINPDRVELNNNTYLSIPHDEICISFDEGQKMITSNDGQGNFNIMCGKNNIAQHVSSASGNSGISQIELSGDGTDGGIYFAVGPTRTAGSGALFSNGFALLEYTSSSSSYLNGLVYATGSSNSPSGLTTRYPVIHAGNARTGTWSSSSSDQVLKVLGDGGSVAMTTNDGGGNANLCFNHASETPDQNGSSWRIVANVDGTNSSMYFNSNGNVTSGNASTGVTTRLEITHTGTFVGSSSNNISDVRLKKNIATITDPTTKIKGLVGRTFEWKDEAELETGTQYGFIAQEMETVVSDLVSDGKSYGLRAFDKDENLLQNSTSDSEKEKIAEYSKGVNTVGVIPILVEALKEAITKIETLETKVAALEGS